MSINIKVASLEDNAQVANLFDLYRQFYKQDSDLDGAASFYSSALDEKRLNYFSRNVRGKRTGISTGLSNIFLHFNG